jgi:hypothetical protein
VYTVTIHLANATNQTLQSIINAKPKFDKLIIADAVISTDISDDKRPADALGVAVIQKVPENLQSIAQGILMGLIRVFRRRWMFIGVVCLWK